MRLFSDISVDVVDPMLARALRLAQLGRGTTAPNPMVGCVLVRDGDIVGEGHHERAGGPHAEVVALRQAGAAARGATAYVTLEPCNHTGRTPPCTRALIEAGVGEVVIGMRDPNEDVAGAGASALERAGVHVRFAEDPRPFEELNEAWLKWLRTGLPWLDVKVALTLDGRPALQRGKRARLTGQEALDLTMRLRAEADAVVVGAATQQIDDPLLTVRESQGDQRERQPLRAVICRTACPSPTARLFSVPGPVLVLVPDDRPAGCGDLASAGIECAEYAEGEGVLGAMRVLGQRGVNRVLMETGPGLFTAAWDAHAIDRLVLYTAGGVGGTDAPGLYLGEGQDVAGRLVSEMRCVEAACVGGDAVTVWQQAGT